MTALDAAPALVADHAGTGAADVDVLHTSFVRVAVARVASTIAFVVMSVLVLVGLWAVGVKAFGLDSFGTKTPTDIWRFLLSGPSAGQHRTLMWDALDVTIKHALTGYVIGTVIGVVLAASFVYLPRLERVTMPIILLTQTVPILAILPLFILLFGRGMMVTSVITTICVFFPTIVLVSQGLRSPLNTTFDYFASCDASSRAVLLKLRLPSAVPSVFVAARMAVPGAMFGAIVTEWLATGNGLGYLMVTAMTRPRIGYSGLWAAVAITTLATMLLYVAVEVAESFFLAHYAPERLIRNRS
jgi:ABC-type nitrate/sulfonate/bicarbonate transport system permease component